MTNQPTTAPEAEVIPEAALAVLGHNSGTVYYADVQKLERDLAALGVDLTETTAPRMRDLMKVAHDKAGGMEEDRKTAQTPHQEKIDGIRAAFRPLVDRALAVKEAARSRLDRFLAAEELRIQQEERDAKQRLEDQRKEAEATAEAAEASPFAQGPADDAAKTLAELEVDVEHAERRSAAGPSVGSASGIARAGSYRTTYYVEVVDAAKMVKGFAKYAAVKEAAEKLANAEARTSKGAKAIPGCVVKERRTAV